MKNKRRDCDCDPFVFEEGISSGNGREGWGGDSQQETKRNPLKENPQMFWVCFVFVLFRKKFIGSLHHVKLIEPLRLLSGNHRCERD